MTDKNVLKSFSKIVNDLENANLEDVSQLLNYYNGEPVLIDGVSYHPYNEPIIAARINARYKELTGEDHPNFLKEQEKVINKLLADKEKLIEAGVYTPMYFDTLEQLKGNLTNETPTMEVTNGYSKHILGRMNKIVDDLQNAKLEDVSELLNYYNGKPVLIDGVSYHPYNDSILAARINARYKELTGKDHPNFSKEHEKVRKDNIVEEEQEL